MCIKICFKSDLHDFASPKKGTGVKYNQGSRNGSKKVQFWDFNDFFMKIVYIGIKDKKKTSHNAKIPDRKQIN